MPYVLVWSIIYIYLYGENINLQETGCVSCIPLLFGHYTVKHTPKYRPLSFDHSHHDTRALFSLPLLVQSLYSPLNSWNCCSHTVIHSSHVTVFINQPATFPCVTTSDSIAWRVNGTNFNDLPPEILSDLVTDRVTVTTFHLFTLTIAGRAEYNGTVIQCVTGHLVENENATLRVQGTLPLYKIIMWNIGMA